MSFEKIRKTKKWTKSEISDAVIGSKSYKEILKKLGMPYHRHWRLVLRELLEEYEISFKSYYRRGKPASELLASRKETRKRGSKKYQAKQRYKRKNNIDTWKFIWAILASLIRKRGDKIT